MKINNQGKLVGTWKQWANLGRQDQKKGIDPRYPQQPDYMNGYNANIAGQNN